MIGYEQTWVVCRTDPEVAARMLCEFSREQCLRIAYAGALMATRRSDSADCWAARATTRIARSRAQ